MTKTIDDLCHLLYLQTQPLDNRHNPYWKSVLEVCYKWIIIRHFKAMNIWQRIKFILFGLD